MSKTYGYHMTDEAAEKWHEAGVGRGRTRAKEERSLKDQQWTMQSVMLLRMMLIMQCDRTNEEDVSLQS